MPESETIDPGTDAARVRGVLTRELETISTYEALARAADGPEVRAFLLHLALEEKEHVAEATALLRRLDADQDGHFRAEYGPGHFQPGPEPAPPATETLHGHPQRLLYALPAPPSPLGGELTVGSLRRTLPSRPKTP
jgi:hypothetical protein